MKEFKGHNRLSAFGVSGTFFPLNENNSLPIGHNRLSAFGVSGTALVITRLLLKSGLSQSPFGFWGEWNSAILLSGFLMVRSVTIAFRLLG